MPKNGLGLVPKKYQMPCIGDDTSFLVTYQHQPYSNCGWARDVRLLADKHHGCDTGKVSSLHGMHWKAILTVSLAKPCQLGCRAIVLARSDPKVLTVGCKNEGETVANTLLAF